MFSIDQWLKARCIEFLSFIQRLKLDFIAEEVHLPLFVLLFVFLDPSKTSSFHPKFLCQNRPFIWLQSYAFSDKIKLMKLSFLLMLLFFSALCRAFELEIVSSVSLRKSPNFIGYSNLAGQIQKGSIAEVVNERLLPSGNKAYEISLDSIKPKSGFQSSLSAKTLWLYGSQKFVKENSNRLLEARAACTNCAKSQPASTRALADVTASLENKFNSPQLSIDAQTLVKALSKQGIECDLNEDSLQIRGIQCKGRMSSYPEPVRFYIPTNFVKNGENTLNFFFHGYETKADVYRINTNDTNGGGDFGARLAEAKVNNQIIVVPESRGRGVTYEKFSDGTGKFFENFKDQIVNITDTPFSKMTFAAHSGGYLPVTALLGYPKIADTVKKIAMFDSTYLGSLPITSWINKYPDTHAQVSWTTTGEVVAKTKIFVSKVERKGQLQLVASSGTHMGDIKDGGYSDFLKD